MKRCKKCGQDKPLTEFTVVKAAGREYTRGHCKDCVKAYFKVLRPAKVKPVTEAKPAETPGRIKGWSEIFGDSEGSIIWG